MNEVLKSIFNIGIIPVIAIEDAEKAVSLAKALLPLRTPSAALVPKCLRCWRVPVLR